MHKLALLDMYGAPANASHIQHSHSVSHALAETLNQNPHLVPGGAAPADEQGERAGGGQRAHARLPVRQLRQEALRQGARGRLAVSRSVSAHAQQTLMETCSCQNTQSDPHLHSDLSALQGAALGSRLGDICTGRRALSGGGSSRMSARLASSA